MHLIDSINAIISQLGLVGVFLVMVVENLGIPFPTEAGFLVAQGLIQNGQLSYPLAITIITLGHVVGACLGYGIGRFGDKKLTHFFARNERWSNTKTKVMHWYSRYGSLTVFATRLIGYVRPWSSLVAGFVQLPLVPFIFWSTIGSLIFSVVSLYITKYLLVIWDTYPALHTEMVVLISILFFSILAIQIARSLYGSFSKRRR